MEPIQKKVFLEEEANAWFERNFQAIENFRAENDMALELVKRYGIQPEQCLEIGSSAGHRLHAWKKENR